MKQQHAGAQVVPYPKCRRWTAAANHSVRSRSMIDSLIKVDVTKPRVVLRAHKAESEKSLSFTAFLTACLTQAVDGHRAVQAYRKGRKHHVIKDDVDVWIPIVYETAGQQQPLPHIVRAANRNSFRTIHDEIRAAQMEGIEQVGRTPRLLSSALFGPFLWRWWRIERANPRLQKQSGRTVCLTTVGMFGNRAGWGNTRPLTTPLMLTACGIGVKQAFVGGRTTTWEYLSLTISVDHDIVDGAPAAR